MLAIQPYECDGCNERLRPMTIIKGKPDKRALSAALLGVVMVTGAGQAKTPDDYPDPLYLACTPVIAFAEGAKDVKAILVAKDRGRWDVTYLTLDASGVPRSVEYSMQGVPPWEGFEARNLKNPKMAREGYIAKDFKGAWSYRETRYFGTFYEVKLTECIRVADRQTLDKIGRAGPTANIRQPSPGPEVARPSPAPEIARPNPTSDAEPLDVVPLAMVGDAIHLSATIGDLPVDMVLDTGATISTVSASLADRLITEGQASEEAAITTRLANGSTTTQRTLTVKSLTVGRHKRDAVPFAVMPDGADMLLGLPVLNAIGAFKIDATSGQLVFSAAPPSNVPATQPITRDWKPNVQWPPDNGLPAASWSD